MRCPHCDAKIILGDDECGGCGESLTDVRLPEPELGRIHEMILADPLSQLNAPSPLVLFESDSVQTAVERMSKLRYGSVLVVDGNESLSGIFTENDLVKRCGGRESAFGEIDLGSVMTPNPQALTAKDSLARALNMMSVGGYRHVPFVDGDKPIGFISIRGILKYLAGSIQ